jgi:cell wall-associated NlpC family hydrolase
LEIKACYRDLIGKPFRWGARGPDAFDCYGLVREIYRRHGIKVPNYTSPTEGPAIIAAMLSGAEMWRETPCAPGTVALMKIPMSMHVGFVLDDFRFIHAWEVSGGVCVERLSDWSHRIVRFYQFV